MTSSFKPDYLLLDADGSWLSGPDPSSLTPILHERTSVMLSKAITLPNEPGDVPHLKISKDRFEYAFEKSPDFIEQAELRGRVLHLRLLGPKTLDYALPDSGLEIEIDGQGTPWLYLELGRARHRLQFRRAAWHSLGPQLTLAATPAPAPAQGRFRVLQR